MRATGVAPAGAVVAEGDRYRLRPNATPVHDQPSGSPSRTLQRLSHHSSATTQRVPGYRENARSWCVAARGMAIDSRIGGQRRPCDHPDGPAQRRRWTARPRRAHGFSRPARSITSSGERTVRFKVRAGCRRPRPGRDPSHRAAVWARSVPPMGPRLCDTLVASTQPCWSRRIRLDLHFLQPHRLGLALCRSG